MAAWSNMNCTDRLGRFVLLLALAVAGPVLAGGDSGGIPTARVQLLSLEGPLAARGSEVSGMTWQGDTLIILSQYPEQFMEEEGMLALFGISKDEIVAAIEHDQPVQPFLIPCRAPGLVDAMEGYDGLEALGIIGHRYFMTVEAKDNSGMTGFLVSGRFDVAGGLVVMNVTELSPIPMSVNIPNISSESILIDGDRVITLTEAIGLNVNPRPWARVFSSEAEYQGTLPMPQIEYRVTDASALDHGRRFWVINYLFPPEGPKLAPAPDPELERFDDPDSYDPQDCIERLLELRLTTDDRIVRTATPPVNLELLPDGECRNWEALVRLDDRGFLLMTDKYPGTLLAFVPFPLGE